MTPKKNEPRRYGEGRAAVLSHADTIRAWLASGRTLRSYYDEHASELAVSYVQLARLTRNYIEAKRPKRTKAQNPGVRHDSSRPTPEPSPSAHVTASPTRKPEQPAGTIPTFQHATGNKVDSSDLF